MYGKYIDTRQQLPERDIGNGDDVTVFVAEL